jgi:hypothetical protein
MKKWMLFAALLLLLPTLACSFSVDVGGETPEPTAPPSTEPVPTPTSPPTEPAPTSTPTQELPTPMPPTPTLPPVTGPTFYDVGFTAEITDDGQPVGTTAQFPPGTTLVYAFASYDGMTNGLECESVWYRDGQENLRDPFTWQLGESSGPLWIANLSNEDGLRSAEYAWELYVEGDLAATASFVIAEEEPSPILYQDDFSDPGSGWAQGELDGGRVGYRDGAYYVSSLVEATVIWSKAGQSFTDTVIQVEATQAYAGPEDDNSYGVMCRVQPNDDCYLLRISGDGYYSIFKRTGESYEAVVDWATSDLIRQGNSTNQIKAVCDGPTLALYVNGQLLAEGSDSTFTEGDIALVVATYEDAPTEVLFDNLMVSEATAR